MNITFLIGNGFDIGIGMKSRFKDFFPIYQEKAQNKPKEIKQLADEIGDKHDTWADFETALGNYTLKFNVETKKNFIGQLKDFEKEFIKYLKENEDKLSFGESVSNTMENALLQYYSLQNLAPESNRVINQLYIGHGADNHTYNFVNFNYTYSLEKCLNSIPQKIVCKRKYGSGEKTDKVGRVVHVHGSCDSHPIIGVNDVSQIANKELAEDEGFARYIIKPSLNKLLRQGNDTSATDIINGSTIICIYGMALGATDKKWWELIIKWLSANAERQLIVFDYDEKYTTSTQFDWIEKEDSIIEKFEQYNTDSRIKIELLRPRIHIAVHKNIFSMSLSKK